jgi:AraC-like DNA-binding protein
MEDFHKKFLLSLLAYASQRGISAQRLSELAGIPYQTLQRKNNVTISAGQVDSLWKNAIHLTGDEHFGLHFGESMQLAALGVIGQIVQTSATAAEALSHAGALTRFITDMFQLQIQHSQSSFRVVISADPVKAKTFPTTFHCMTDFLLVFTVHELRGLVLEKIQPSQVNVGNAVGNEIEYQRVFGTVISHKPGAVYVEFPNRVLGINVLSANYELQNHLLNQVNILMKPTDASGSFHKKVYNYLLSNSFLYSLTLEAVAANFNMSVRSLQRKLKEEGTNFLEIVDAVRMALAITYLKSGHYPVKDVAYALGYNEHTAFVRAFKRWTGKTPVAYKTISQAEN